MSADGSSSYVQVMTELVESDAELDRALKAKHRVMWALGNYPAVATEVIAPLGPILAAAVGSGPGQRILDVGAGSGNAAIPAARSGATVVASDLTPDLLETGRQTATHQGLDLTWDVADAEDLPYADASFDAVISCVGVMFAPHHQVGADELLRVCRPGGTIGLLSWTPAGFIGQLFATMKPFAPPPPPGAQPPPLWGDETHVRSLLGDHVTEVTARTAALEVDVFATGADFRDYFKRNYGPTIAVYRAIADDPGKTSALDRALADLGDSFVTAGRMEWEYLLLVAKRA